MKEKILKNPMAWPGFEPTIDQSIAIVGSRNSWRSKIKIWEYEDQKEQKIETNMLNWSDQILSAVKQKSKKCCMHTVRVVCVEKMTSLMVLPVQLQPCAVHLEEV